MLFSFGLFTSGKNLPINPSGVDKITRSNLLIFISSLENTNFLIKLFSITNSFRTVLYLMSVFLFLRYFVAGKIRVSFQFFFATLSILFLYLYTILYHGVSILSLLPLYHGVHSNGHLDTS